jgi:hypothetical protein
VQVGTESEDKVTICALVTLDSGRRCLVGLSLLRIEGAADRLPNPRLVSWPASVAEKMVLDAGGFEVAGVI